MLHLEDNSNDARLLQHQLAAEGVACSILLVGGRAGFESALAGEPFDLILLDYNLPGYQGTDALEHAQAHQPDAPVIIISGTVGEDQAVKCLQLGATDYLLKDRIVRLGPAVRRAVQEAERARERRANAAALVLREQALGENQLRTEFALAAAKMGVWEIEFATNQLTWSGTMAPVFGLAPEQAPRTTEQYFALIHADDRPAVRASVARAIGGERDYAVEFRTVWPDGELHWVQGSARVLYEPDGTPLRLLGIGIDITARKLLEARLAEAQRTEARINKEHSEVKDQLFSRVSHELRTPLAAIDWFTSNLSEGLLGEVTAEQSDHLSTIHNNVRQLERMIADFLDVSRAELGKLNIVSCRLPLPHVVVEAVTTCQARSVAAGVRLRTDMAPDLPLVWADPDRTRQILLNLIENGIKFTPAGGTVTVRVRASAAATELCVSVADTGCGIAADSLDRIFEPLFQGENGAEASRKGLGLGLFISKELVSQQGGRVWAESEDGHGATVFFTVPVFSFRRALALVLGGRNLAAGPLTLLSVHTFPSQDNESAAGMTERLLLTRQALDRCVAGGEHLILPPTTETESGEPFLIAAGAHDAGAGAIRLRIQQRLAVARAGQSGRQPPVMSTTVIECPDAAEYGAEQSTAIMLDRIADLALAQGVDAAAPGAGPAWPRLVNREVTAS